MNTLRNQAAAWLASQRSTIRISVAATRGSTPQAVGAQMLVCAQRIAGTIGGGNLEWQAIAKARSLLSAAMPVLTVVDQQYNLGPSLGQCCGGAVSLRFETVNESMLAAWRDEAPLFELQLHGMGHVATALVEVLAKLACVIHWHDSRPDFVDLRRRQFTEQTAQLHFYDDGGAPNHHPQLALIMTHSHAIDFELCRELLRCEQFRFVGLIGSDTKRAQFLRRLQAHGVDSRQRSRLTCPIGLPQLNHKQPELLAISIAAHLLSFAQSFQPVPTIALVHA
jgi:xanthine dehydrogenase accessory factor